ncbi:Rha family transcriptional regulator [Croceicoccus sp. BE223]|uniref:Rha family transcriptional regulator n=1 Tax=Croceicoccus sp. BE223 TaxID=2817716 RepID=UPI00285683BC|nr:Rha family transcriptional regulator [Croceicoccus sp. BE223]MDR7101543.1 Rha family phage regulatory protein [Croceicoccus sp. BE223]
MNALVRIVGEHALASSRTVAEIFEKQHKHVLASIDRLIEALPEDHRPNFRPMMETVEVGKGAEREVRSYEMTRDGFCLLAMGFTGVKALEWKVHFLDAFNAMEAELTDPEPTKAPLVPVGAPEEMQLALSVIREARHVFGKNGARRIWMQLGLPTPDMPVELRHENSRVDLSQVGDVGILAWMSECLAMDGNAPRIKTQDLHRHYLRWCEANGHDPVSVFGFGRILTRAGVRTVHSNGHWRTGVAIAA